MMEFVRWDDEIPTIWKVIKFMFQTTTLSLFSLSQQKCSKPPTSKTCTLKSSMLFSDSPRNQPSSDPDPSSMESHRFEYPLPSHILTYSKIAMEHG